MFIDYLRLRDDQTLMFENSKRDSLAMFLNIYACFNDVDRKMRFVIGRLFLLAVVPIMFLSGCSSLQSSVSEHLAQSLSAGISNQADIEMVKAGIPSYLLMIDGMIVEDPENPSLYLAGAKLYSAIANFVNEDQQRLMLLTEKAHHYSEKVLCLTDSKWCAVAEKPLDAYQLLIRDIANDDVELLYVYGSTWASQIQAHKNDWNAVADLPKVKATMQRVIELDETHDRGGAHLYLGVLESLIPPALGGKPEIAKTHFERVIEITKGRHLMAKVMYAERYARTLYNRELHDQLLQDVLAQDPKEQGLTLANIIAQQKAKTLLESAEEYF